MTFDEAKRRGRLPNISEDKFLAICEKCGIDIKDIDLSTRAFTEEELRRLSTNRYVHSAAVNASAKRIHKSVVGEYDKMLAKYKALYESVKDSSLSNEDKQGILNIINDLEQARNGYESVRNNINVLRDNYGYDQTMLNGIERIANSTLKEGIRNNDYALEEQYKELNKLVEEGKKYKTKFKRMSNQAKINRVMKKIESLQTKQGTLNSIQQRMVNKATAKYISKREKEIQKYAKEFAREQEYANRRIENNKQIEDYTNDIGLTSDNIVELRSQGGIKNNLKAFELSVEKKRMESRLNRLEREKKRLDRLKGKQGVCNLGQQYARPVTMAYGM